MTDAVEVYFVFEEGVTVDAATDAIAYCDEVDPTDGGVSDSDVETLAERLVRDDDRQGFRYGRFDYTIAGPALVAGPRQLRLAAPPAHEQHVTE